MAFRRDLAAETLINVAGALRSEWANLSPDVQEQLKRLIDELGHAIYQNNPANRVTPMLRLLDSIAALPNPPRRVLDALSGGAGAPALTFTTIPDALRDRVLAALCEVYDARLYQDEYRLAEELHTRVGQSAGQLDAMTLAQWKQLDGAYQAGGSPREYLDKCGNLLGDRLPFVRDALEAGKSWAVVVRYATARPPQRRDQEPAGAAGEVVLEAAVPETGGAKSPLPSPAPATPAAPRVVQRSANVYFPETVQLSQKMIPLIVHLARAAAEGTVTLAQGSSTVSAAVGDLKIYVHTLDFDFGATIGGVEIPDVPFGRVVRIEPDSDSEPVVFFLTPASIGIKRISIEFIQAGKRLGSLAFDVSVADETAPVKPAGTEVRAFVIATRAVTPGQASDAPDLNLRVGLQGSTLTYALTSADGKYAEKKLGQMVLQGDPKEYFGAITNELSQLAALDAQDRTPQTAARDIARLQSLGVKLWNEVLSADFRQAYKDDLRQNYAGRSLVITSDEPWIPWEMVRPLEREDGRTLFIDPPLCEQFRLTRWLKGPAAPDLLQVKRGVVVAPEDNLPFVQEEIEFFKPLQWAVPIHTYDEVNQEFTTGQAQLFHFSCHGSANTGDADEAIIKLGDDYLTPSGLLGQDVRLWQCMPLVFVNACDAGQGGLTLTGLGGWAEAFIELRATAFIGSLWAINDELAAQFARSFYNRLWGLNGQTQQSIGEAFHAARQEIKAKDPANPTWLAYVLYGDPNGRVYIGS